jgi:hypothetical protein
MVAMEVLEQVHSLLGPQPHQLVFLAHTLVVEVGRLETTQLLGQERLEVETALDLMVAETLQLRDQTAQQTLVVVVEAQRQELQEALVDLELLLFAT